MRPSPPRRAVLAALLGLALAATACSGDEPTQVAHLPGDDPGRATHPADPVPDPGPARSPFTGRMGEATDPVLVVKIDNTGPAHPQAGLTKADVVYVEEVEYGLTRLAAVFSSRLPDVVGPVRSARIADIELFAQYGKVAFAYSGAQQRLIPQLLAAPLYPLSDDAGAAGFYRTTDRYAPYNLFASPADLLAAAPKAEPPRDIGFRFGDGPPGGRAVSSMTASYPSGEVGFRWSAPDKRWLWSMDGMPAAALEGGQIGAATVVVQYVDVFDSGFGDKFGGRTPMSRTVGRGKALVLRDGKAFRGRWEREKPSTGTTFSAKGEPLTFAVGPVWVVLLSKDYDVDLLRTP